MDPYEEKHEQNPSNKYDILETCRKTIRYGTRNKIFIEAETHNVIQVWWETIQILRPCKQNGQNMHTEKGFCRETDLWGSQEQKMWTRYWWTSQERKEQIRNWKRKIVGGKEGTGDYLSIDSHKMEMMSEIKSHHLYYIYSMSVWGIIPEQQIENTTSLPLYLATDTYSGNTLRSQS